jgi:hypothetical protein
MFELHVVVAGIVMFNILELIMEIVPNYPTVTTDQHSMSTWRMDQFPPLLHYCCNMHFPYLAWKKNSHHIHIVLLKLEATQGYFSQHR